MNRYVLLEHQWNGTHYDLMFERQHAGAGSLATWKIEEPLHAGTQYSFALPDHRVEYLQYEGEISGNRGKVRRIAHGVYETQLINGDTWKLALSGSLQGELTICRLTDTIWQMDWQPAGQ